MNKKNEEQFSLSVEDFEKALTEHGIEVRDKFSSRIITIIIAGFGLITVLAWDEVLQDIFLKIFGGGEITLGEKVIYALAVTLIATSASALITRYFLRKKKAKK